MSLLLALGKSGAAVTPEKTQHSIADHETAPHTSVPVHIYIHTHRPHDFMDLSDTVKTGEAVGTADGEETLK